MDERKPNDVGGPSSESVAGATGGVGGAVAGAALGSLAGPIGTIIGGLAGAVGGWWAGKAVVDSPAFNSDDDSFYQAHHQKSYGALNSTADGTTGNRPSYNDVRPAYQLGHLAGVNPDYQSRAFEDVEPHLKSAYSTSGQDDWDHMRGYAHDAWTRGRQVGGERLGSTTTGDAAHKVEHEAKGFADRVADAADDVKDRFDGNPASRPGRDETDRPGR